MTTRKTLNGTADARNQHVRFDEGKVLSAVRPRRMSLFCHVKNMGMFSGLLAMATLLCGSARATTWHVNGANGNDVAAAADATGATRFRTIQAAIVVASANDTILVDPGVYTGPATTNDYGVSRLFIDKVLTIESTGSRDDTFIEGAWDSTAAAADYGMGLAAIRCVCATNDVTFKGFTFLNGATTNPLGGDQHPHSGGGFYCNSSQASNLSAGGGSQAMGKIMDCAFVNCSSRRGGGMRYGTAYRTLFKNCYANLYGAAVRQSHLLFCLIEDCSGANICGYMGTAVNCTFVNNTVSGTGSTSVCIHSEGTPVVVNCVFFSGKSNVSKNSTATAVMNGSVTYDATFGDAAAAANSQTGVWGCGVFSPLFGDYHPYVGGPLDGTGDATVSISATSLDAEYRTLDFEGKPVDWVAGKLCPGAFQTVKTPASGKLVFRNVTAKLSVDGVSVGSGNSSSNYTFETCWPTQHFVKVTASSANSAVLRLDMSVNGASQLKARPPLTLDDTVWVTAPPPGNTCEWAPLQVSSIVWVDDDNYGHEGLDGKTEATAFGTIQDALDTIGSQTVVKVKPGVYDQGCGPAKCFGAANRVELNTNGYIRLMGVEGAANTVIVGATDTSTLDDSQKLGCGDAAMRCLALNMNCVVQGFTLTGGHSGVDTTATADTPMTHGGAVRAVGTQQAFVADCIISNNVAKRGAGGYYGNYIRCRFTNNRTIRADGMLCNAVAANCVFEGTTAQNGAVRGTTAYNCTMAETNSLYGSAYGGDAKVFNCVCYAVSGNYAAPAAVDGTVAYGFSPRSPVPLVADPAFRDRGGGDYRLATVSPAVGLGEPDLEDWWKFAGSDINGNRYKFIGGKVVSGAYQELLPAVKIGVTAGPTSGISQSGVIFFNDGDSLTVTATDAETRLYKGFALNGEIVEGSAESASFTYAPPVAPVPGDTLEAVYLTNWYVNATSGRDSNSGESPERAKQTLAAALEHTVSGDVVHAAEGVYATGTMLQSTYAKSASGSAPNPYIRARVVVSQGVQLVADGARENTVILGKSDSGTVDDPDKQGCGPNAERCVVLRPLARIKGFTLRGGRSDFNNLEDDNNQAGGLLSVGITTSIAEDCQIEDCRAVRGGGAWNGTFFRCRFIGNSATMNGTASRQGYYRGCYFDDNCGPDVITFPSAVSCCTFGPGNTTASGGTPTVILSYDTSNDCVEGSLFCTAGWIKGRKLTNCAFPDTATFDSGSERTNCVAASAEALARLDASGAPIPGENPACDASELALWTEAGLDAATDAAGNPRIQNAAMDIGCYEADWKGRYAAAIGGRRSLTVTSAAPMTHEESNGEVFLPGDEIAGTLHSDRPGRFIFPLRITGTGTLAVTLNGTTTEYQGPRDTFSLVYDLAAGDFALSFSYAPGENDEGGTYFGKGGRICGTSFVIR